MFLKTLKIRNFRNINAIELSCNTLINYFYSPNGTGKTNVLESIQCLSIGKSLRAKSESELADLDADGSNTVYVHGAFDDEDGLDFTHTFSIEYSPAKRKVLLINKTKTATNNFVGKVPTIWFSPESIKIIDSSPRSKRKYFDDVLIQLFPEYMYHLKSYEKSLKQRNRLLQNQDFSSNMMRVWTEQLIQHGAQIIEYRKKFIVLVNENFASIDHVKRYVFKVDYSPNIKTDDVFEEDASFVFREALRKSYEKDKVLQSTTVGPHKDDWHMLISITDKIKPEFIPAHKFASRGQQRMSLIVLQIVLINIFQMHTQKKPILLLDDIFSELDTENEEILVDFIEREGIQTFITGVEAKGFKNIKEYCLRDMLHS